MKALAVPKDVEIVSGFAAKFILGSLGFFCVALTAVGLYHGLLLLERWGAPPFLSLSAPYVELAIWIGDLVVYAFFLVTEVWESVRETAKRWKAPHG